MRSTIIHRLAVSNRVAVKILHGKWEAWHPQGVPLRPFSLPDTFWGHPTWHPQGPRRPTSPPRATTYLLATLPCHPFASAGCCFGAGTGVGHREMLPLTAADPQDSLHSRRCSRG